MNHNEDQCYTNCYLFFSHVNIFGTKFYIRGIASTQTSASTYSFAPDGEEILCISCKYVKALLLVMLRKKKIYNL